MKIKVCLLDMDGTTLDSERIYLKASVQAAKDLNYDIDEYTFAYYMGWGSDEHRDVLQKAINVENFDYDKWMNLMQELYEKYSNNGEVKLVDGTIELLDYLNNKGIKPCICTGTNRSRAVHELKKLGIYDKLDFLVCGDDIKNTKPSGDCHRLALKHYNILPEEAIVIEDAKCGYEAAKDANIRCILVPGVIIVSDELKKQADYVAKDLFDVINILEKIN